MYEHVDTERSWMAAVSRRNWLAGHFVFSASSASCLPIVVRHWEMAFFSHSLSLEQIQLLFPCDRRGSYVFSVRNSRLKKNPRAPVWPVDFASFHTSFLPECPAR